MYTTIRRALRHARKAWPGTLVDPCLLSAQYTDREKREVAIMALLAIGVEAVPTTVKKVGSSCSTERTEGNDTAHFQRT